MIGWLGAVVIVVLIAGGLRLRGRLRALSVLPADGSQVRPQHRFVTAEGVVLDERTRRAVSDFAAAQGLDVVDLVPADLSVGRVVDFAGVVDVRRYRADRLAPGWSVGHAMLVDDSVLARAGITQTTGVDPVRFAELAVRLKLYACASTDFAVAGRERAGREVVGARLAVLRARVSFPVWVAVVPPVVAYVALVLALIATPWWGLCALIVFCLRPYLVCAGTPLRPADLHGFSWARPVRDPLRWVRTVTARRARPTVDEFAAHRSAYAAELAQGTDRFFEPRRPTCPWCGSPKLAVRLATPDLLQRKPGRFTLERCESCGHIFQNPRLSLAGLDFYYRDFYDGLGEERVASVFAAGRGSYRWRARMPIPFTTPRRWLDVGAGHGHFCADARDTWPDTVFDGLDMSDSVTEAQRRGWVDHAYLGMFPDLADTLAGHYDVVSMHHYLEHTREPREELRAAATVLADGGYLLIELPNPESRMGRFLGRLWLPWFQPQHQHLIPLGNLLTALREHGFHPVAIHRGQAHTATSFTAATLLALNWWVPNPRLPWLDGPYPATRARRLGYACVRALAVVPLVFAFGCDNLLALRVRRTQGGNAYRLLARKHA